MIENYDEIFGNIEKTLQEKRGFLAGKVAAALRVHRELREPISVFSSVEQEKLLKRLWDALTPDLVEIKEQVAKVRASKEQRQRLSNLHVQQTFEHKRRTSSGAVDLSSSNSTATTPVTTGETKLSAGAVVGEESNHTDEEQKVSSAEENSTTASRSEERRVGKDCFW